MGESAPIAGGRRRLSLAEYRDGILGGNRLVLARAITLVESTLAADAELALELLEMCLTHTGRARRVGITGVPGAGKSTFLEALGTYLTREREETVAVLSIDPSSPLSGGSILGDKTRMEKLATDERAFIRPSPAGRQLGGVARRTRETMLLCEAAGFQNIFIETVGVGQSESSVRSMVDTFVLLMLAGAGDELQGIKRGITELTDVVAVHKADGENRRAAERARTELELALHYFPVGEDGWRPRVLTCSARSGDGIEHLWDVVLEQRALLEGSGYLERRRRVQMIGWMREMIAQSLEERFFSDCRVRAAAPELEARVRDGQTSAFRAAADLLAIYERTE